MPYTTVVNPKELAKHLDDPDWIVFDCRFTLTDPDAGKRLYDEGHIPGAHYAHLDDDLSSSITDTTGRHPLPNPEVLASKLGAWGVDSKKQVVVYDDVFGAMAVRFWWLLRWLGHENVALLDGVYPKWVRKGNPVSSEQATAQSTTFTVNINDSMWITAEELQQRLKKDEILLIDARAEERYSGEVEPLDSVAGHVPGAINLPWEDNLDIGGEILSPEELKELYQNLMENKEPSSVINMCGSGVTACHNILAMEHAGLSGSKLFAGSWSEWIRDVKRPVATGEESG